MWPVYQHCWIGEQVTAGQVTAVSKSSRQQQLLEISDAVKNSSEIRNCMLFGVQDTTTFLLWNCLGNDGNITLETLNFSCLKWDCQNFTIFVHNQKHPIVTTVFNISHRRFQLFFSQWLSSSLPSIMATADVKAVNINFIFANYEKKVILATTLSSTGHDLKTQLLDNWPDGKIFNLIH